MCRRSRPLAAQKPIWPLVVRVGFVVGAAGAVPPSPPRQSVLCCTFGFGSGVVSLACPVSPPLLLAERIGGALSPIAWSSSWVAPLLCVAQLGWYARSRGQ